VHQTDPKLKPIISEKQIQERISQMARQINADYRGQPVMIIGVLKGVFVFMADLVRQLEMESRTDFLWLASYGSGTKSSGRIEVIKDIDVDIREQRVLVVEDIVDSGRTLAFIHSHLEKKGPREIKVCALLDKRSDARIEHLGIEYMGFQVDQGFLVGYGLDLDQRYRHLPDIYRIDMEADVG